jgi:hypothetical protein
MPGRRETLSCHHRVAPVSAFTRVFDALWARDPVIQPFAKKMDRRVTARSLSSGRALRGPVGAGPAMTEEELAVTGQCVRCRLESIEVFGSIPNERTP